MDGTIALDPRIRDLVLVPITVVMFLQGVLRQSLALLAEPSTVRSPKREDLQRVQVLQQARRLRVNGDLLPAQGFLLRKAALLAGLVPAEVLRREAHEAEGEEEMPQPDMEQMQGMMDGMKSQVTSMLPNMLSMGWVSYLFSGFILVRLPFPMGDSFKSMLQQGINLPHLDASYVSSLSWYFLNLFGFRGIFTLVLGQNNAADDAEIMRRQMQSMQASAGAGAMGKQDKWKENKQEKIDLEIASYQGSIYLAQYRLLNKPVPKEK